MRAWPRRRRRPLAAVADLPAGPGARHARPHPARAAGSLSAEQRWLVSQYRLHLAEVPLESALNGRELAELLRASGEDLAEETIAGIAMITAEWVIAVSDAAALQTRRGDTPEMIYEGLVVAVVELTNFLAIRP